MGRDELCPEAKKLLKSEAETSTRSKKASNFTATEEKMWSDAKNLPKGRSSSAYFYAFIEYPNIDWLKKTYGEKNVVAATLYMDETIPHIHASIVPIVQGERRQKDSKKKKQEQEQMDKPKRKYKKKDPNRVRLCCDDVMAKQKLIEY